MIGDRWGVTDSESCAATRAMASSLHLRYRRGGACASSAC
jgi:hypothetical protein